jgi:Tol biopolymer transport system component
MKPDGSDQVQLTKAGNCSLYQWSPDSRRIAFVVDKDRKRRICVVEVATGKHTELTDGSGPCHQLAWAPDGKRLLYVPGGKEPIHTMNADGTDDRKLPGTEGGKEAVWSPDGKRIAFSMFVSEPLLGWQLFTISPDGKDKKQLSTNANYDGYVLPGWSPDGNRIAYGVLAAGVLQIGVVSAAGGETRVITTGDHPHTYARWSPDGKSLAYLRTKKAERPELFVSDPDGREAKALLPNIGYALEWQPK